MTSREEVDADDIAAFAFAAISTFFLIGWVFISLGAVNDLASRWRGCFGARRGHYDLQVWENSAMQNLIDTPDMVPLAPEVHRRVVGFQSLTEACALVHRPGSFAHKNQRTHRLCALMTTLLLPINLIVFEYTARDFHCMSRRPWAKRSSCADSPPPSREAEGIGLHVWGVVGLLLPSAILVAFWFMQDQVDVTADLDDHSEAKFSHFERIIRLTSLPDQALLSRSMDKWATRTLIAIALNLLLIGCNLASDLYVLGGTGLAFFEVLFIQCVILVQEFLIVATLLTTALHVRIARKITLLNLRRKFMTLDDSKLFAWMRTREDFRDFANSFLDEVMEPFATSLAWIIWFVVLVLGLLVLNILLFCIFPFNTRWLLGGYESAFFLAIGIEGGFAFMAYTHMYKALSQVFLIRTTVSNLASSGLEPMLLILEALGFDQIDRIRHAQSEFTRASISDGVAQVVHEGEAQGHLIDPALAPFRALDAALSRVAEQRNTAVEGARQESELPWAQLVSAIGLPETLPLTQETTDHTQALARSMIALRSGGPIRAADGSVSVAALKTYSDGSRDVLSEWSAVAGIDDVLAIEEFTQVLIPQFAQRNIAREVLLEYLRMRFQLSEAVRTPLVSSIEWALGGKDHTADLALD
eukprot:m.463704 g.463704  ORF g.463704 m.463704 type:complete len:642 (+) comp23135_c0_seq1:230-2155(+)